MTEIQSCARFQKLLKFFYDNIPGRDTAKELGMLVKFERRCLRAVSKLNTIDLELSEFRHLTTMVELFVQCEGSASVRFKNWSRVLDEALEDVRHFADAIEYHRKERDEKAAKVNDHAGEEVGNMVSQDDVIPKLVDKEDK